MTTPPPGAQLLPQLERLRADSALVLRSALSRGDYKQTAASSGAAGCMGADSLLLQVAAPLAAGATRGRLSSQTPHLPALLRCRHRRSQPANKPTRKAAPEQRKDAAPREYSPAPARLEGRASPLRLRTRPPGPLSLGGRFGGTDAPPTAPPTAGLTPRLSTVEILPSCCLGWLNSAPRL